MSRFRWRRVGIGLLLLPAMAAACASISPARGASSAEAFSDPFAYCAAVGTADAPDARYSGPAVPDAIINGFKKAAGLEASTEPLDVFRKATIWRCMNGKVYACNFGANLTCDSKADANSTPSPAMNEFCAANPGSEVIPMSVTGHATVFNWSCASDKPHAGKQIVAVDAAGYLANIWYAIEPGR